MSTKKTTSTKKGFTLIELMVVLAIIGLLSAIAIPIILTVQRDSRDSQRLKQLDAVRIAAASFITQYPGDIDVYEGEGCSTVVGTSTTSNNSETRTYSICPQNATNSNRRITVTLTAGYFLQKSANGTSCGANDKSSGQKIVFAIQRASSSNTGKLILCKENGGQQELEYKQG